MVSPNNSPKKKSRKFIHPDRIEDLDKRDAELEKKRREAKPTGYVTHARLRNTKRNQDLLLPADFVRRKMPTCLCMIFKVLNRDEVMLQPVPARYMKRTSICHAYRRPWGFLRRYGCHVTLDAVPEPCTILHILGLDPLMTSCKFRLEEYSIMDDGEGEVMAYKLIPEHPF